MGQKVNPIGLRIGIIKTWDSVWYADKKTYVKNLHEDLKIKNLIKSYNFVKDSEKEQRKVISPEISKVRILRKPDRVLIVIHTSRPGVVIGQEGKNISDLCKIIGEMISLKVEIKINEEKEAEKNAQLIAQNIAKQLQNRIPFRRAMKKVMGDAKKSGIGGIKIQVSGRLGGADMARTEWYKEGRVPLHTLRADIDYGSATAHTSYGCIGVKVWVFKKEVLKKEINADAGKVLKSPKKDRNFVKKNENNGE